MTQAAPEPVDVLHYFGVQDDELCLNGIKVSRLAERVGSTPFYAYDRRAIDERVALLRRHLPRDLHLHYAMKANPMPAVVQHFARLVDGIDVASAGEMMVALDTGTHPTHISFAGPAKSEAEIRRAVAAGITLNLESERELDLALAAGRGGTVRPRLAVRVNPPFELKGAGMRMGGSAKQFGIDAERVPDVCRRIVVAAAAGEAEFVGLHIYAGSQCLKAEALAETQRATFALAYEIAASAGAPLRTLNIGGGFGIPYFPGDKPLDLAAVGAQLETLMQECRQRLPGTQVVVELGRYLVGEAGVYVCRVVDRKISRGEVFLVTDGGLHHHLAASGNFGQVIRKNYPVVVANRVRGGERERSNVVGPLCTPLDVLGASVALSRADVGDLVAVMQSGAYGLSASPQGFLSHPAPREVLI
jgi:diaminopimelate decarboxylase